VSTLFARDSGSDLRWAARRHRAGVSDAGAVALAADVTTLAPALYHADRQAIVPRIADPGYVDALAGLVREHDVRLVVPPNDLDHPVSRARDALAPALLLLPEAEMSDRMSTSSRRTCSFSSTDPVARS
jgi:hypothetical protein